jgi:hypothetical protein
VIEVPQLAGKGGLAGSVELVKEWVKGCGLTRLWVGVSFVKY